MRLVTIEDMGHAISCEYACCQEDWFKSPCDGSTIWEDNFPSGSHLQSTCELGVKGEEEAYFALRREDSVMVARNYRSPRSRGEIDLIAWDGDVLCFIEVKTRTSQGVKTAEAAVDRHKRREMAEVAREYLRKASPLCQWRFDIVSVYYEGRSSRPQVEIFRNASLAA